MSRRSSRVIQITFSDYSESSDVPTIPTGKILMNTDDSDSYYYVSEEDKCENTKPKAPPEPSTPSPRKSVSRLSPSPKRGEESESASNCFVLPQGYISELASEIVQEEATSFIVIGHLSGKDLELKADADDGSLIMQSCKEVNGREKWYSIRDAEGIRIGFIRKWSKGRGYSLCSTNRKERDDRDGELMGIGFKKDKMRVVVTRNGKESWAVSKRRLLASIAQTDAESDEKLIVMNMDLQNMKLVDNATNDVLFSIMKTQDGFYQVTRKSYITKLHAYGIAYLILKKKLL